MMEAAKLTVDTATGSHASQDIWTIRRILDWSAPFLKERGLVTGRLDAELLLADVLECNRLRLYLDIDRPLSVSEKDAFRGLLKRRAAGEPVAYIRGERDFMGHGFKVTPAVLIPRPDTEVLVEQALADNPVAPERILDIGTGSGCIAIALAKRWAEAYIEAWDVSAEALAVAAGNAILLEARVEFLQVDAHRALCQVPSEKFDVIVSNPPYIARGDTDLGHEVAAHEPEAALFCDHDGLSFYRLFATAFADWLNPGGQFLVEVGHKQSEQVCALFVEAGFDEVAMVKDYGGNPRVVKGRLGKRNA